MAVLVAGLGATFVVARHQERTVAAAASRSFVASAGHVGDQTRLHLSRYEDLLAGLQVLHRASARDDSRFGHDLARRVPDRRYAGYQALVVAKGTGSRPARGALQAHIEPHALAPEDVGLTPRNIGALDEAMRRATDTAAPTVSSPLPLTDSPTGPVNLIMWAPLYPGGVVPDSVDARRAAVTGWVGVAFRSDQFFNEALVRTADGIGTEVFVGSPQPHNRIAVRPVNFVPYPGPERITSIAASGRVWSLRMQPLPLEAAGPASQVVISVSGALLSVLLALFIASLRSSKSRALRLADEQTGALRRSEQRFRSLTSASPLGVFGLSAEGRCEYANEQLCELTGRTLDELQGTGLSGAYHPDDRAALRKAVTGRDSRSAALRLRLVLPDGSLRWVKTHAAPLLDDGDALTGWVGSVEDVTAEVQAQVAGQALSAELAHQARHDHLTGLPNRGFFTEQIDELIADPDSGGVTVLFFDVDRFKVVNDSLGHAAGDRLLIAFAQRLRDCLRPGDLAARFGGDEFVAGLIGVDDPESAAAEAQRLLGSLNRPMVVDGHEIMVSVSMGVASSRQGPDAETLMTHADTAMYRAKARGKARFELYRSTAPSMVVESTLRLEQQLRTAINDDQLRLFHQPIVSVETGEIVGVEALVRWQHPQRGFIPPAEFIPLAEDSGLIVPLGAWVLRAACRQVRSWQPLLAFCPEFSMSVNVSTRQLVDPQFPDEVARTLAEHDVNPRAICLEITETALLQDFEAAEQALRTLRGIGVRIAVDDFGTGYSSLSHLRLLPIDMIKIDKSFVRDLGVDADNTAIVGAVIRLADALGLTSVAEGVEEPDQLTWLASMGCDLAQGYHLAMPEPAEVTGLMLAGDPLVVPDLPKPTTAAAAARVSPNGG